jgi:putative ABC transport system substrate-binding protein
VRAQQPGKLPTIGFLGQNTAAAQQHLTAAFLQRLRELGWTEGRNFAIEYRWLEGRYDRSAAMAAELIRQKVDLIVTAATANVVAAKQVTSTIPIIFAASADPIGAGIVASLARPGGNATGISIQGTDVAAKRLTLLQELVPGFSRLAVLANMGAPGGVLEMREVQAAAQTLGLVAVTLEIRRTEDIVAMFEGLAARAQALYVVGDPLVFTNRTRIATLALAARLPTIYNFREHVEAGGLMSYGPNFPDLYRRAADYADKILRGARPEQLPVEQPTKFDLVVNLVTAKALGLQGSAMLLARADEVIE